MAEEPVSGELASLRTESEVKKFHIRADRGRTTYARPRTAKTWNM